MSKILANLTTRQRITILVVAIAVAPACTRWCSGRGRRFPPLFTGVSPEDAASIVQKLKESGAEYRLPEGGGSVLVPSARLAELRLTMASIGLPKSGRMGFELFDKVNLGATEFTEKVNYRRALEGELERTVMALAEVETARVHLTFPKDSVFLESQQPAKASVLVRLKPGARLAPQNVIAINNLVASAVEGLSPDAVSLLDMNGNLLSRPKAADSLDGTAPSAAALDYRHQIETDLIAKISATLGPLLGPEKFRAGVSVECDFSGGELSEEIFDPARSVMVTSQRTEDNTGSADLHRCTGDGFHASAAHLASQRRLQQNHPHHRKHLLSIQPQRQKDSPARGRTSQDVPVGTGGPGSHLGKRQERVQACSGAADARKIESDSGPGSRNHRFLGGARRPAGD